MKPVTDPSLLSQLNGLGAGLKPVTDRSLLSQLDGSQRAEAVRIDDFLNQSGAPAPLPTSSFGAGISSRALGIVGDLIEGAARIGEQGGDYLERKIPLSGLSESQIQERQLDPLFKAAEWFKRQQQAINYQPSVDFQQVKADPFNLPQTGKFIVEQGVNSIPDMAAAVVNLPGYILSRTNNVADERAKNEGRPGDVTLADMAKAAPGAIAEATLERFATGRLLPGKVTGASAPSRIAKQVGIQAGTEGIEEVAGYAGETVGTKTGFNATDATDRFLAGALVGGPAGGTVQSSAEVIGRIMGSKDQSVGGPAVPQTTQSQAPIQSTEVSQQPANPISELGALIADTATQASPLAPASTPTAGEFLAEPEAAPQAAPAVSQQDEFLNATDNAVEPSALEIAQIHGNEPVNNLASQDVIDLPPAEPNAPTTMQQAQAAIPESINEPAFIDLDKHSQLQEPKPGMRIGDIVFKNGSVFKTNNAAKEVAKKAGKGWVVAPSNQGYVVRFRPQTDMQIAATAKRVAKQREVNAKDSMLQAISKLGGINSDELVKDWGVSLADLSNKGSGVFRVATKAGVSADRMASSLKELGFISQDENGKQEADRAAEARALADAEVGQFNLTGSDREADVQAAQGQQELGSGDAVFSMNGNGLPKSKWLSEAAITQIIEDRMSDFAHQPPIFIRDMASDVTAIPEGAEVSKISGLTINGKIYIFRAGISSGADVTQTLWHELLHYGIRRFMTESQYIAATKKLYNIDGWIKGRADSWMAGDEGKEVIFKQGGDYAIARGVDEALADIAEANQGEFTKNSLRAAAIRSIARWISFLAKKLGFHDAAKKWSGITNDEARSLIKTIFGRLRSDSMPSNGNSGFTSDPTFRIQDMEDDLQDDIDLGVPKKKFEKVSAKDLFSLSKNEFGQTQYTAGLKLYKNLSTLAAEYLGSIKLADNKPEAFKQMMRQFKVDQLKANENAKRIAEAGMELSPEQRETLSDLIEKNAAAGDLPPNDIAELAAKITAALDIQSKQLIDLGMISEERLVKNYLPRLYKHGLAAKLTNPTLLAGWFTKARMKIRGERLKTRGMFAEMPATNVAMAKKLGWMPSSLTDGAELPKDLFEAFDKSQPIPPYYQDTKVLMWRDYTESERAEMGEIRDGVLRYAIGYVETQKDVAIGRLFKAIAGNTELAKSHNPGGWKQVPNQEIKGAPGVKQFGALSGMYVNPQVLDALTRNTQPKGMLMAAYDKALNFWKEGKTVWNPVSHGNNVVSNLFTVYFAGVNPANPSHWRETLREFRTKGQYWNEAVDNGLFGNEFANQEIQNLLMPDFGKMDDLESVAASRVAKVIEFSKKYPGKPLSWYRENMQNAYEFEDQFFKLMLYIDRRKSGMEPQEAITDAERYVFNYSDMPEGIELLKRTYSPFFAYTYKAIPMVIHTAMTRPDRLLAPIALLGGANWLSYMVMGGYEDKERKGMPEYMQGRTAIGTQKSIRMPFNIEGNPAFMDMSRRVPLGDLFDMNNQTNGLPVPAPFMPSHPVLSMLQAVIYNQDTFTGKDLVKKSDTKWEAAQARGAYMYRQFAPNAPMVPGSYNFNKLIDASANTFDAEIGPYTGKTKVGDPIKAIPTALDVFTGTKIRSVDVERGLDYQSLAIRKEAEEIRANIRSAQRNQAMTPDSKGRYIASQQDKFKELQRKNDELRK